MRLGKFIIWMRTCVRAHYAGIRVRVMNSTRLTNHMSRMATLAAAISASAVPRPHLLDQTGGDDRINPHGLQAGCHTEQRRVKN